MKTTEQKKKEFVALMATNSYALSDKKTSDGRDIYTRTWNKLANVVWQGQKEYSITIEVYEDFGYPIARIYHNGKLDGCRNYSSPKRAVNAIREIVTFAGYDYNEGVA